MIAVSIDGRLVAPDQARVSVFDRGFLFGDGVFEVFRTYDEAAVDLDAHLDRLFASAAALKLRTLSREHVADATRRTLANSGPGEKRIRVVLTRGVDEFIPLRSRVARARACLADSFLSIHADALPDAAMRGLSVFTLSAQASDREAGALAVSENKADLVGGITYLVGGITCCGSRAISATS